MTRSSASMPCWRRVYNRVMPTLLILSKNADTYRRLLEKAGLRDLEFAAAPGPGVDILFGEPNLIRGALPSLPALAWVQSTWAGVDPLLDPSLRRDYTLTNARGVFGGLMSEFVFGYLLLHERRILQRLAAQLEHRWDPTVTGTLRGKTIGLMGVGSIGAALAETAKSFGMTVRGYTRESEQISHVDRYFHPEPPSPSGRRVGDEGGILAFARRLDYLVSVLPNTSSTQKIINAELLSVLSPSAFFINVGRGSAVDEPALIRALETGALAGAVLDVFAQEPLPAESPLWDAPNTFITSHTSAPSFPEDIAGLFIENYRRYLVGEPLKHAVDFERGY